MKMRVVEKVILAFVAFVGFGVTTALAQAIALQCTYSDGEVADVLIELDGSAVTTKAVKCLVGVPCGIIHVNKNGGISNSCQSYVQITRSAFLFGEDCSSTGGSVSTTIDRISGVIATTKAGMVAGRGTCIKTGIGIPLF